MMSSWILGSFLALTAGSTSPPPTAWGDFDGDGRLDLFMASPAGDRLFRSRADGGLDPVELGLSERGGSRFGIWHDFDGDGRLDLYRACAPFPGVLLRNLGAGSFAPVELPGGAARSSGSVAGARFVDYDGDGRADLELHGDFGAALFHQEDGWFTRVELGLPGAPALVDGLGEVPGGERAPAEVAAGDHAERVARHHAPGGGRQPAGFAGPRGGSGVIVRPTGTAPAGGPSLICADTLRDQATASCIEASSAPALGKLYPLSLDLNVDGAGHVGMGTLSNGSQLHVRGAQSLDHVIHAEGANTGFGISVIRGETTSPNAGAIGVEGKVSGPLFGQNSTGVAGFHDGTTSAGFGVWGSHAGTGIGVYGQSTNGRGVYGVSSTNTGSTGSSISGLGVYAQRTSTSGTTPALLAESSSSSSLTKAIHGVMLPTSGGSSAAAVRGENRSTTGLGIGVWGSQNGSGWGVYGYTASGIGVRGQTASSSAYAMYSAGDFGSSGTKFFVQPHPTDASKEVRFVCLEGDESGTYFRGTTRLVNGRARIDVPESFRLVSEERLTVQLTPVGAAASLWVESRDLHAIVVRGDADVELDYFVNGVRRGFADHEPIRANHSFVPELRGVPYGTQYPEAYRRILVESGVLNADFTPNEATAARLGWSLRDPEPSEVPAPAPPR